MQTEYIIIGTAALFIVVSIILGILNWILLSSTSTHLSFLENEIEKKAREFDNIRKEQRTAPVRPASARNAGDDDAGFEPVDNGEEAEGGIEIVRNVRSATGEVVSETVPQEGAPPVGIPEAPAADHADDSRVPAAPPPQSPADEFPGNGAVAPQPLPDEAVSVEEDVHTVPGDIGNTGGTAAAPLPGEPPAGEEAPAGHRAVQPDHDVLDIIEEPPADATTEQDERIGIALYSRMKKDADFDAAFLQLKKELPGHSRPRVELDFSNVLFLYEKEMALLQTMLHAVIARGGTMTFVRCAPDVRDLLLQAPLLADHVADGNSA